MQRLTLSSADTFITSVHVDSTHQVAYIATNSQTNTFVKLNLNPLGEAGGTSFSQGRADRVALDPAANVAYITLAGYDPIVIKKVDLKNYTVLASSTLSKGIPINALYLDKANDALFAAGGGMIKLHASDLTTLSSVPRVLVENDFISMSVDDQTGYGFLGENIKGVATIKAMQLSDLSTLEMFSLDTSEGLGNTSTIIDKPRGQGVFAYHKPNELIRLAVFSLDVKSAPSPGSVQLKSATYSVDESGPSVTVTATRTAGTSGAVSVSYATTNGTAVAGSDFTAASGKLSWADGDAANKTFNIPITDDTTFEGDETFSVGLSSPAGGATLGSPAAATVTINDNDVANPGTLQLGQASYSVDENGASLSVGVTRSGGINGAVSVNYTTSNGTALGGSDYTAVSGTLSWADGVTGTKTFSIPITDDTAYEGNETFNVTINTPGGGATLGSPTSATVTIVDNDTAKPGTLQIEHATYSINESGPTLSVAVTRTGGSDGAVSVAYATSDGTAQAGSDYTATSGTLSWASGDAASKTFSIPITDDAVNEGNETFNIAINAPTGGAALGTAAAVATILDNEIAQPGTLSFGSANYTVNENGATLSVSVSRSNGKDGAVSVGYKTVDATALAGSDYTAASGTLSWADGADGAQTFSVTIKDDQLIEGDETFTLQLQSPTGDATLGNIPAATATIVDNEVAVPGTLAFEQASMEVNENVGTITVSVKRTSGSDGAVSVHYATSNGGALAGSDYTANSGTLSWADGDSSLKKIPVAIVNDTVIEPKESFELNITQPTGGATIGSPSSLDVLIDDDDLNPVSPTLGLVTPNEGPAKGGTRVTLRGTGFMNGITASFAGTQASELNFIDDKTLQATTPAGPVGWADVVVRNPNAMEARLLDGFEFIDTEIEDAPLPGDIRVIPTLSLRSAPVRFSNLPLGTVVHIYNSRGQVVATLNESSGSAVWNLAANGRTVASGTYMYRSSGGIKGRIIVVR
jgi:ribosomal protein L35AE/L33A